MRRYPTISSLLNTELTAKYFRALGDPAPILELLVRQPRTVTELTQAPPMSKEPHRPAAELWMRVRDHIVGGGDDQPNPRQNDAENNGADGDDGKGIHGNKPPIHHQNFGER
jgi:hypothetical protein